MYTLNQLKEAINKGLYNDVYKEVRRYGDIVWAVDFEHLGKPAKAIDIRYRGVFFGFELLAGNVIKAGCFEDINEL